MSVASTILNAVRRVAGKLPDASGNVALSASDVGADPAGTAAAAIAAIVDSSPAALDTLNELSAALGDDANFATTVTNALAGKESLANKGQPNGYAPLDADGNVPTTRVKATYVAPADEATYVPALNELYLTDDGYGRGTGVVTDTAAVLKRLPTRRVVIPWAGPDQIEVSVPVLSTDRVLSIDSQAYSAIATLGDGAFVGQKLDLTLIYSVLDEGDIYLYGSYGSHLLSAGGPFSAFATLSWNGTRWLVSRSWSHSLTQAANGYFSNAEGNQTVAPGAMSHAEGSQTTASGEYAHAQNISTTATGGASHAEGSGTVASGYGSHAGGHGSQARKRGQLARGALANYQQTHTYLVRQTTNATQAEMTLDGYGPTSNTAETESNRYVVAALTTYACEIRLLARQQNGTNAMMATRRCIISRNSSGVVALIGAVQTVGTDIGSAWGLTVQPDNTYKSLQILVTGVAATSIRWHATVIAEEVTY
ncbi:MAG TPA: hypothetical protein VK324_13840 [Tepidisphaeraceae bacterium]|nr:hypothetical protein [Tepidisphaeraceae bacterium]